MADRRRWCCLDMPRTSTWCSNEQTKIQIPVLKFCVSQSRLHSRATLNLSDWAQTFSHMRTHGYLQLGSPPQGTQHHQHTQEGKPLLETPLRGTCAKNLFSVLLNTSLLSFWLCRWLVTVTEKQFQALQLQASGCHRKYDALIVFGATCAALAPSLRQPVSTCVAGLAAQAPSSGAVQRVYVRSIWSCTQPRIFEKHVGRKYPKRGSINSPRFLTLWLSMRYIYIYRSARQCRTSAARTRRGNPGQPAETSTMFPLPEKRRQNSGARALLSRAAARAPCIKGKAASLG